MSDTISPWDKAVPKPDVNQESGKDDASRNIFNPLQLLNEGAKAVKDYGSKIAEQSNKTSELLFPSIYDNKQGAKVGADVKGADAKGTDTKGTDAKGTDAKGTDAKGTNTKGADAKGSDAIDAKVAPKPAEQKAADTPTQAEADGKLRRAKLTSTQLPTYYVGLREWLSFRKKYQDNAGKNFNLLQFNDRALDEGPLPVPLVEKIMMSK